MKRRFVLLVLFLALFALLGSMAWAQGATPEDVEPAQSLNIEEVQSSAFVYQGRLIDNGVPATGVYDFRFKLFDSVAGGTQIGTTIVRNNVVVQNGLFTVVLNFGSGAFTGEQRWLQVEVRPGASVGSYSVLTPRQPIYTVPYALSLRPEATIKDAESTVYINKLYTTNTPLLMRWKYGVYAVAEGTSLLTAYYGVYGKGSSAGVYGFSDVKTGYGGMFINGTSGGVGLFARSGDNATPDIVLGANSNSDDNGVIASDPDKSSSDVVIKSNDNVRIDLDRDKNDSDSDFTIVDENGDPVFNVDDSGDLYQPLSANGLAKAGIYAYCGNSGSAVHRYFNNVNGAPIQVSNGSASGECWINFPFDVSNRFWAGMATVTSARTFSCRALGTRLHCFRADVSGNGRNGDVMVIVY